MFNRHPLDRKMWVLSTPVRPFARMHCAYSKVWQAWNYDPWIILVTWTETIDLNSWMTTPYTFHVARFTMDWYDDNESNAKNLELDPKGNH
ncbi:hypothetical protein TNCV_834571 [Trichonephila clavipes]|nr:hypothetical protein TNCV_834571 [Trichonephila clavipes]